MNEFLNELVHRIMSIIMNTIFTIFQLTEFTVLWFTHFADTVVYGRERPLTDATKQLFRKIFNFIFKVS